MPLDHTGLRKTLCGRLRTKRRVHLPRVRKGRTWKMYPSRPLRVQGTSDMCTAVPPLVPTFPRLLAFADSPHL